MTKLRIILSTALTGAGLAFVAMLFWGLVFSAGVLSFEPFLDPNFLEFARSLIAAFFIIGVAVGIEEAGHE